MVKNSDLISLMKFSIENVSQSLFSLDSPKTIPLAITADEI